MLKILHNPRCSKSRKTLQLIQEKNIDFEIVEYLKDIPTVEELKSILSKLGLKPVDILRKGEAIYKEKFKTGTYSDAQWIENMIAYPKLIERPIVISGNKAVIGRPPEKVLELF